MLPSRAFTSCITLMAPIMAAVALDVFSRKIVGWAIGRRMKTRLVLDALNMAVQQRRPINVIHHSDQGSQYTSIAFGARCVEAGVQPSMGSVGDAYDNAMCESFFSTYEAEVIERETFKTKAQAEHAAFECIEGWYNQGNRMSFTPELSGKENPRPKPPSVVLT